MLLTFTSIRSTNLTNLEIKFLIKFFSKRNLILNFFFPVQFRWFSTVLNFWWLLFTHSIEHSKIQFFAHTQQNDVYSFPRVAPNCKFRKNFTVDAGIGMLKHRSHHISNSPIHTQFHIPTMENGCSDFQYPSTPCLKACTSFIRDSCLRVYVCACFALVSTTRWYWYMINTTITCTALSPWWC